VNSNASFHEIRDWLSSRPEIERYSLAGAPPVNLTILNTTEQWKWEGLGEDSHTSVFNIHVDDQYLDLFQIPLIKGRFFRHMGADQDKVVINEKLANLMGFEDPIGRILTRGDDQYEIIGVVRDFNFQHLSNEIRPLLFLNQGEKSRHLFVRVHTHSESVTGELQKKLSSLTGYPVNFIYIDEMREQLYSGESQILAAVLFFTILCIVLSSLGLIGMVSRTANARAKEIAIRKVFGAASGSIMITQQASIFKMFVPGMFIGGTLAWFMMKRWLQDYAYRNGMEVWVFIVGPAIILVLALLSIGLQTWNSSSRSPADSLRHL
jgi:putative ABC transport system permease protein